MNNHKFKDYIDVIYPEELEIKDTTDVQKCDNYLELRLEFDEGGKLYTQLFDKRDDIDFPMVNFAYLVVIFRNPLHVVFLFHVVLGFLRNIKIFCSDGGSILVSKLSGFFTETSDYFS